MESFTARANPQNGLRAVLQEIYESLEMFVLVDYMYFADLVKEFAFEARTLPPKRVTETCEALFSNADLLQSFRNARVNFARFALESMIPEICAAGINVMCDDNVSDLLQIIEFERQAWSFKERWCEMWATVCEFTGHSNQREDGQNILAGVVSLSVAQGCKMEKKEQKDEQMIASARGQTMSCHSLYINRIMRLGMPYDAAPSKIAAVANALQAYVWENISSNERSKATRIMCTSTVTPNGDSIYADSVDTPTASNMVGIVTILSVHSHCAQPMMWISWIELGAKKIDVPSHAQRGLCEPLRMCPCPR